MSPFRRRKATGGSPPFKTVLWTIGSKNCRRATKIGLKVRLGKTPVLGFFLGGKFPRAARAIAHEAQIKTVFFLVLVEEIVAG